MWLIKKKKQYLQTITRVDSWYIWATLHVLRLNDWFLWLILITLPHKQPFSARRTKPTYTLHNNHPTTKQQVPMLTQNGNIRSQRALISDSFSNLWTLTSFDLMMVMLTGTPDAKPRIYILLKFSTYSITINIKVTASDIARSRCDTR